LRSAIAARFGVAADAVVFGNGSSEVIWLVALAYVRPGATVAIFGPTFGEYERAVALMGARVASFRTRVEDAFHLDVTAAVAWLRRERPAIAALCNPNNPTGAYLDAEEVAALVDAAPATLFVIDEAYAAFVRGGGNAPLHALLPLIDGGRVVLLRSMTKDYALTGLRLGYALAAPEVTDALARARPPWSVNAAAQAAGLAALADQAHLAAGRRCAVQAIEYLESGLRGAGYTTYPTRANFLLVEVGDAAAVRRSLLPHGLVVRDCTSFGLPSIVRIAARPLPDCARLVDAMRAIRATHATHAVKEAGA
jgi:histidinol-phosphate aminotransferase